MKTYVGECMLAKIWRGLDHHWKIWHVNRRRKNGAQFH